MSHEFNKVKTAMKTTDLDNISINIIIIHRIQTYYKTTMQIANL